MYNRFFDMMECSLSLSCEEACRLALTSENPMRVLNIDDNETKRTLISSDIPYAEQAAAIRLVRGYLFSVMDCSDYTLDQKLVIIGILIQSLKDHTETDQYGDETISQDSFARVINAQSILLENRGFDLSSYLNQTDASIIRNIKY